MKRKLIVTLVGLLFALTSIAPAITAKQPNKGKHPDPFTIQIGVIAASYPGYESNMAMFGEVIAPEINEYLGQLPGTRQKVQVEFLVVGPDEDEYWYTPERHLEELIELEEMGVELFIAGSWSSQFSGSMEYVTENDLLMVSPSSTAPVLAIEDNCFRLAPPDTLQATVVNEMLRTYDEGIDAIVVLLRDDVWANGVVEALDELYDGEMISFSYPTETTDFTEYLSMAEEAAQVLVPEYGEEHVGVFIASFDENVDILQQVVDYSTLYDLSWFGTESTGRSGSILDYAGVEACHVHLVSALGAAPDSLKFNDFNERWSPYGFGEASFYTATNFDAAWLITQAALDSMASFPVYTGDDVAEIFPQVAYRYYGYSGWTLLDEYGDRTTIDNDIWGFGPDENGEPSIIQYGRYDSVSGEVSWSHEPRPWEAGDCTP